MKLRMLVAAGLAASALAFQPAAAVDCPDSVAAASAALPHTTDPADDWAGIASGNGSATTPFGDVYREGGDLLGTWIGTGADGFLTANVVVQNLNVVQPNSIFYVLWDYPGVYVNPNTGAEQDATRRWVSARLKGTETAYQWGYMGPGNTPASSASFVTVADTTGSITPGENGVVSITIPKGEIGAFNADDWGAVPSDTVLENVIGESRFLVGSPQQLPPNPSGFRYGFVYAIDITDGDQCPAYVP